MIIDSEKNLTYFDLEKRLLKYFSSIKYKNEMKKWKKDTLKKLKFYQISVHETD